MKFGLCKASTDYRQALSHMYKMLLHAFKNTGIFVQILAYTFKKCCKAENLISLTDIIAPIYLFEELLSQVVMVVAPGMPGVSSGRFRILIFNAGSIK